MKKTLLVAALTTAAVAPAVFAGEHPAGDTVEMNGMEIAAVYLQPINMEPRGMGLPASKAEVHLEADIHALSGNKNGFGAGEWIPYLTVNYKLTNTDTGKSEEGTFMPMVASDGPHYGANINMLGVGNYKLTFHIDPPSKGGMYRHTDEETGVGRWFKPFDADYSFKYVGLN
ncbi:iron transporter [Vibrio sp.]|uniref:Iron transporter n=1 Tax=Vibrio viridaestus TaxID=2487322 RepID=A0A3N9TBZ3_9VIBR|nr:iron transporter [Vibrio viridaestus]MDC0610912.1 iron transporter [Vibrio sp.]RQW61243.1 iron transporter [Vibrio viridaestus]